MESRLTEFSYPADNFQADGLAFLADLDHFPNPANTFETTNEAFADFDSSEIANFFPHEAYPADRGTSVDVNLEGQLAVLPSLDASPDVNLPYYSENSSNGPSEGGETLSPPDYSNSPDPVLKYIHQMLMEENVDEQLWISPDPDESALQHTERSLYDALGEKYPDISEQIIEFDISQFIESPKSNSHGSSSDHESSGTLGTWTSTSNSTNTHWPEDPEENGHALIHSPSPGGRVVHSNKDANSLFNPNSLSSLSQYGNGFTDSSANELLVRNMLSNAESILQFNKGLEEASKFLPSSIQLTIDPEKRTLAPEIKESVGNGVHQEKGTRDNSVNGLRGRKNHERDDASFEEGRANKQTALNAEEGELSEMLDKVLLWPGLAACLSCDGSSRKAGEAKEQQGENVALGRRKKKGNKSTTDLRALLILCAQAVSNSDFRTANELLKQIRRDSSPNGDGSQRLAHYFANGLEERLAGSIGGNHLGVFHSYQMQKRTVADKLKAYQLHLSACPLKKLPILFANLMILKLAEKATVLHIIDFGISYGFQWPILIQELARMYKVPPKLRITGIELPQPGFRPAERIEDTGRRLEKYCQRFGVPFEFHAVASRHWETIKLEDLKIETGETIAVNCLSRFKNLFDETVEVDCPRDAVLRLIRSIKPDIFIQTISNGSYNAPFFLTRFREALFHLSAIYDMFDATIAGDNEQRLILEREFYGREIMNVVACEGLERVERPETYKQWQARLTRAGFKQLPLDRVIIEKLGKKLSGHYHKDFVLDEENNWKLLGWRGRIITGCSCWAPM